MTERLQAMALTGELRPTGVPQRGDHSVPRELQIIVRHGGGVSTTGRLTGVAGIGPAWRYTESTDHRGRREAGELHVGVGIKARNVWKLDMHTAYTAWNSVT